MYTISMGMTSFHLGRRGGKEVVNLTVGINGTSEILWTANLRLNKMVTVHGGWDGSGIHAR
jgi:hypothetical protein